MTCSKPWRNIGLESRREPADGYLSVLRCTGCRIHQGKTGIYLLWDAKNNEMKLKEGMSSNVEQKDLTVDAL
jgi:hypothetical protein